MSFTVRTALLLCSLGWVSLSESQTVEVQPGENVTLLCSNFSAVPSHIIWFRVTNTSLPHCISRIYSSTEPATFCNGVEHEKFEVTSNISTVFLKIKHVDLYDYGFYFCGYNTEGYPVIVSLTILKLQEEAGETTNLPTVILSCVTIVLTKVIIYLVVKIRIQKETHLQPEN